jgi:hypothetical protein
MNPSARRADVIVQDTGSDTIVYDQLRDAAHSLSPVTGYVFRHADGSRSVDELRAAMSSELGVPDDAALVAAALWELESAHLLEQPATEDAPRRAMSRRDAVRRFGTAALALAAVTSIVAPTPAMAKSRGNLGGSGPNGPPPGRPRGNGRRNP